VLAALFAHDRADDVGMVGRLPDDVQVGYGHAGPVARTATGLLIGLVAARRLRVFGTDDAQTFAVGRVHLVVRVAEDIVRVVCRLETSHQLVPIHRTIRGSDLRLGQKHTVSNMIQWS
jgi:hypothetical protein